VATLSGFDPKTLTFHQQTAISISASGLTKSMPAIIQ